jgi:hypothetical protein
MDGWSDTQGAYRFFSNARVTPEKTLQPHRQATLRRMREHAVVLIVQDTSELDYTSHPARDALCLNQANRQEFLRGASWRNQAAKKRRTIHDGRPRSPAPAAL